MPVFRHRPFSQMRRTNLRDPGLGREQVFQQRHVSVVRERRGNDGTDDVILKS